MKPPDRWVHRVLPLLALAFLLSLFPAALAQQPPSTSVFTNKPVYLPGETVTIFGMTNPSTAVGIEVYSPGPKLEWFFQLTSASDGSWSKNCNLASGAATGVWTVKASCGGPISETTFLVGSIATVTVTSVVATASATVTSTAVVVSSVTVATRTTVLEGTTITSVKTVLIPEATETTEVTRTVTRTPPPTSVTRTETTSMAVSVTATSTAPRATLTYTLTYTATSTHRVTETVEKVELLYVSAAFLIPLIFLVLLYILLRRRR